MYKDNKSNTFKTIPFEINFDRTVDETVGLIDNIDDYDIIGFKLNLNEDIMEQLSNFSFAVSEMLSETYE